VAINSPSPRFRAAEMGCRLMAVAALCAGGLGCQMMSQGQNSEGVRLFEQGHYHAAAQRFHQAIQTDANNADSYYNLAATHHRLGKLYQRPTDLQQAESYYHQCLDKNPDHVDCRRGLAVLLVEQGRGQDALRLLENWVQRSPALPDAKIELARLYEEFGDRDAAKTQLVEALVISPDNPRALAALGHLREQAGDYAQAVADYQRSLSLNRFQPQIAARVASLQAAGYGLAPPAPAPAGTRLVAQPNALPR
jgi:tetratricopeptide (TPR) repeat protein